MLLARRRRSPDGAVARELGPRVDCNDASRPKRTLSIAGQLAMHASGAVVGLGDARAQARQCSTNLAAILAHYGGSFRHLVKTTTYITHWGYRAAVAAARDEVFPPPPILRTRWSSCRAEAPSPWRRVHLPT